MFALSACGFKPRPDEKIPTADEILQEKTVLITNLNTVEKDGEALAYLDNELYSGVAYHFFSNGTQQIKQTYLDGRKEGEWSIWYEDGTPQKEGFIKDGKQHGAYREYYSNGNLRYEYEYDLDRKTGTWRGWYDDGTRYTIREFTNDTLHGKVLVYDEKGDLAKEYDYHKGQLVGKKMHFEEKE
ncbi:MAG: toxin-antitoxin system YwqK family antitoxin [Flavobacteriales bacterium]|nr:toxin-antitoxin system YwqK family antitoxin [Flavobacteriales bacterium]